MSKPVVTLASGNAHKYEEFESMLGMPLHSLKDVPGCPDFVEDGDSFEANALIKARGLRDFIGGWALADDSGLAVDVLDGAPGIHSARFAGEHGNDAANNQLLLEKLEGAGDRTARFVCVLALCGPDGEEWVIRGECVGQIAHVASGEAGFGYDPLFHPEGHNKSFAELGADLKHKISHRSVALEKLLAHPDQPLARFL
ncbi:RdgB/HAM1 family non-canonical purine NTP pyrophosphatase [Kiritimatiellaeota bacterium B1221]|nr:RdgB/HAM1 family non-canonical purine NTP pyrophosphatase [Kiritimatiellaeota bacterium B1221]